jgi:putative CocE/NonD family hydrolase
MSLRLGRNLLLSSLVSCLLDFGAQSNAPPATVENRSVMIPMRDGVKLATDVYRPAQQDTPANGKFPALLLRTPYNKTTRATPAFISYFVSHGYAVVVQDVRGRYKSEGHWRPLRDDGNDGSDTASWVGHQPWSDGAIGTYGTSYEGGAQHALAIANAPFVKAMIPLFAMSDVAQYGVRHNGAFELRWFNWVFCLGDPSGTMNLVAAARAASDPAAAPALAELSQHVRDYILALPLRKGTTPLKFAPDYEEFLVTAMGGNEQILKDMGIDVAGQSRKYKDIPVYHVTGWYDSWALQVANLNFPALRGSKKSLQRLIVGPWVHSRPDISYAGDAQFTADAAIDLNALQLRWFDHTLKGIDNGVDREPPVRLYVMGGGDAHKTREGRIFVGGHWRDEQEWPLARTKPTDFYLSAGGILSTEKPEARPPAAFLFDPRHPVPTLGGNISSQGKLSTQGATDQRCQTDAPFCTDENPLSARNDVLVYQSPPLKEPLEVTGRLVVKLWAASDSPDTDFTAKLVDVYPPNKDFPSGIDLNIGDSIVRARYRNGLTSPEVLKPGQPYEFTIEMYPTSVVFARGHRIRLDISSSNFPRFDVNPNTGEPLNDNRRWRIAQNSIYADPQHPSHITLPLIPVQPE